MSVAASIAAFVVAALHVAFFALESLLWTRPQVRRSFGLTAEYPVHPSLNLEFLWSHQSSDLEVDYQGTPPVGAKTNLASLNVDTIQIGGLWQSGRSGDKVRGHFDFLLGASILSPSGNYDTLTRFSMTMGGGAKFRISDKVGVRRGRLRQSASEEP